MVMVMMMMMMLIEDEDDYDGTTQPGKRDAKFGFFS